MKKAVVLLIVILIAGCGVRAKSVVARNATLYSPNNGNICLLAGAPPGGIKYEVLGRIVATKRTYGGSHELFAPMARQARLLGADAIINLQAGQRFKGPLPWRIASPTGSGQAIKVLPGSPRIDCLLVGGNLLGPDGLATTPTPQAESEPVEQESASLGAEVAVEDEPTPRIDLYEELLKLDELRKSGLLTDAEFESEKKKLLERN